MKLFRYAYHNILVAFSISSPGLWHYLFISDSLLGFLIFFDPHQFHATINRNNFRKLEKYVAVFHNSASSPLQLTAPVLPLATPLRPVVRDRGADEVVSDAEQAQQHRVRAHRLGKVSQASHLHEESVDGGQDVSEERNTVSIRNVE